MRLSGCSAAPKIGQVFPHKFTNCIMPLGWDIGITNSYNDGCNIWTDGTNIYCGKSIFKNGVFEKDALKGGESVWDCGLHVWTDGSNIYYSDYTNQVSTQYVLEGDTWVEKTWNGYTNIDGYYVWRDGTNVYYSNGSSQYVLEGDTWVEKTWNGYNLYNISGNCIWTDGTNIYCSNNSYHFVLTNGDTWEAKVWNGIESFSGMNVWTDGTDIYVGKYVLKGDTWVAKTWLGSMGLGNLIWTDGTNIYGNCTSILLPENSSLYCYKKSTGWVKTANITSEAEPYSGAVLNGWNVTPTVKGVWVFNDTIDFLDYAENTHIDVSFTSVARATPTPAPCEYIRLTLYPYLKNILYIYNYNGSSNASGGGYYNGSWDSPEFKTIDFGETEQVVSEQFYEWLLANATSQEEKPDTVATITYKGETLYSLLGNENVTLYTKGQTMEDDICVSAAGAKVYVLQEKEVTANDILAQNNVVTPDSGYNGLSKVSVNIPVYQGQVVIE